MTLVAIRLHAKLLIRGVMSPKNWKNAICDVVEQISNEKFQRTAWFGLDPNVVSSPDELFCTLFDDFVFDDFLTSPEVDLTPKQRDAGQDLKIKLGEFVASTSGHLDPRQVIDDERWREVRLAAHAFLQTLIS